MSENKTKEEIIWEHTANDEYPGYYHESDIELMMTEFADQEKRCTAIAFHIWLDKNSVPLYSGLTIEQMYDLYLQSLSKTD